MNTGDRNFSVRHEIDENLLEMHYGKPSNKKIKNLKIKKVRTFSLKCELRNMSFSKKKDLTVLFFLI